MQDITMEKEIGKRRVSEDGSVNRRGKKASVSFSDMLRLMNTYGSIKCLRNHQKNAGGINNTKDDSVRRKFYRWFPDLDERFKRDHEGTYHPKYGHEFEINYRERMRKLDGELLAAKRTGSRKEHLLNPRKAKLVPSTKKALILARARQAGVIPVKSDDVATPTPIFSSLSAQESDEMVALIPHTFHDSPQESAAITSDIEPVDMSFIAERGIFDDVETSFFSPTIQDGPSSRMQACSPAPEKVGSIRTHQISPMNDTNYDSPFIDDILDKSIEECCDQRSWERMDFDTTFFNDILVKPIQECYDDNVLVSEDSDSVSDAVYDAASDVECQRPNALRIIPNFFVEPR
jgi:hypothetical protein